MKFVLLYEGDLTSNANSQKKWEIRKQLDPQLQKLWTLHPALLRTQRHPYVPTMDGYMVLDRHHSAPVPNPEPPPVQPHVNLIDPVVRGGRPFRPLVSEALALRCGLNIHFLRQEEPGRVYQGGDIDNRLKTLFDALSVPQENQVINDGGADPIFCLLEDDKLIAALNVETHRLLAPPGANAAAVKLMIEVNVRVAESHAYNQAFLGD